MPEAIVEANKYLIGDASSWREGERQFTEIMGREVGVFAVDGGFVAFENVCPHSGGPVCRGRVMPAVKAEIAADGTYHGERSDDANPRLACPWHGWEFELRTGRCIGASQRRLRAYDVIIEEGKVYVVA